MRMVVGETRALAQSPGHPYHRCMAYMLVILEDPAQRGTRTRTEGEAVFQRMLDFARGLQQSDQLSAFESLASQQTAARVQVRAGKAQVLDGPFAEAKEMIGGFFLLKVKTREEALAIAGTCPAAEWATVEVRETAPCYI
jgi:hypothetical protein